MIADAGEFMLLAKVNILRVNHGRPGHDGSPAFRRKLVMFVIAHAVHLPLISPD
jgi:hypothetical protein